MLEPTIEYAEGDIYYGSTIQPLYKRLHEHKKSFRYNRPYKSKILFEKYGIENVKIILIKNYPCNNKNELEAEESTYIRNNKCVNLVIPNRSVKEWYETNNEILKEKKKEYYQENKDLIKEKKKEYYQENQEKFKEQFKIYRETNKEKLTELNKKWRETNKEQLKEKSKKYRESKRDILIEKAKIYRENNREKINEQNKEKVKCECGCEVVKSYLKIHKMSKKHAELMKNIKV